MHKGIAIGLGAALATFAVGITEADASCKSRRACRCGPPPAYGYLPPPPPTYRYGPPAAVYGYAPPPTYNGYGPSAVRHYYQPAPYGPGQPYAYGPGQPYAYGPSYYGLPPPIPKAPLVGYQGYGGYAPPPYYDAYRPAAGWIR